MRETGDGRRETGDRRRATGNRRPETGDRGDRQGTPSPCYRRLVRRLIKFLVAFFAVGVAMWVVGQILSENYEGDEADSDADEFRVGAVLSGKQVVSRAKALRSIETKVFMGGVDLDLRDATLAPRGAHLSLNVTAGGVRVAVPPTWLVVVADDVVGGAVEVDTTPADDLPTDAPVLTVEATVRSGGVMIEAGEASSLQSPAASPEPQAR